MVCIIHSCTKGTYQSSSRTDKTGADVNAKTSSNRWILNETESQKNDYALD